MDKIETDAGRLLTPKEIRPFLRDTSVMVNDMLKAQFAKDKAYEQARVEKIKREIETRFSYRRIGKLKDWQEFWKQEGVYDKGRDAQNL